MPIFSAMSIAPAPALAVRLRLPPEERGPSLISSGVGLVHVYTSDTYVLAESDLVQLQVLLVAYQVHPATCDELAALGPVDGPNASRWTIEGPLVHVPGDPGEATNCAMKLEIQTSMTDSPVDEPWRDYEAGRYRLRSARVRLTITRPSDTYGFSVHRFTLLATRLSAPQRSRRVRAGGDAIPAGMCRIVVYDFEIDSGATLEIEAGGYMEVLR